MTIKSALIALSAAAAMAIAIAPAAEAKVKIDFGVNAYLGDGVYVSANNFDDGFYPDEECFYKKVKVVKWHDHGGWMHKHKVWKKKLVCY